tara:strand:+ start:565 stop:1089 length:525 start_codon:yes stop_codon:yes gene_type:complete
MIKTYDNALEPHVAELIDMQLRDVSWKYNYDSVKNGVNKHWHVFCGHNLDDCYDNGYDYLIAIWNFIKKHNPQLEMERVYLNAHTHGIEPHRHVDDGDFTIIYYPRLDWQMSWGGGTLIEGDYNNGHLEDKFIDYKGNRLIIFTAGNLHQAQPVSRECYELRTCVVFKTNLKKD